MDEREGDILDFGPEDCERPAGSVNRRDPRFAGRFFATDELWRVVLAVAPTDRDLVLLLESPEFVDRLELAFGAGAECVIHRGIDLSSVSEPLNRVTEPIVANG